MCFRFGWSIQPCDIWPMLGECHLDRTCRHLHLACQRHLVFCHIYKKQGWIDDPGPIPSAVRCPKQACSLGKQQSIRLHHASHSWWLPSMQAFHGFNDDKPLMAAFYFCKPCMAQHMYCKPWWLPDMQAFHGFNDAKPLVAAFVSASLAWLSTLLWLNVKSMSDQQASKEMHKHWLPWICFFTSRKNGQTFPKNPETILYLFVFC